MVIDQHGVDERSRSRTFAEVPGRPGFEVCRMEVRFQDLLTNINQLDGAIIQSDPL
jgi:hypothetical protein